MANKLKILIEEEFEEMFRFPILEILIFFIIFIITQMTATEFISNIQSQSVLMLSINIINVTALKSTLIQYKYILDLCSILLILIMSITISNSVAGSYEKGMMQTFLSYPIKRNDFLFSKLLTNFLISFSVASISMLIAIALIPVKIGFLTLTAGLLAVMLKLLIAITMITTLSIFLKNALSSSLISILFWISSYVLLPLMPRNPITYVFSPIETLIWLGTSMGNIGQGDLAVSVLGSLSTSLVLLILAFIYFNKYFEMKG